MTADLPFDISDIKQATLQTLGLVYHWGDRRLRHVPRRIWRTYLAAGAILKRRKLLGRTLSVWIGHAVKLMQLCPEAMSCFSACYRFVTEAGEDALRVWPSVRGEARCAMYLLFLLEADLSARYNPDVYCGGASDRGFGLLMTQAPGHQIREAWRWRERWRYSDVATERIGSGRDSGALVRGGVPGAGLGLSTEFGKAMAAEGENVRLVRKRGSMPAAERVRVEARSIPALDDVWVDRARYRLVCRGLTRHRSEHINLKEARVAPMGLCHCCRSVRNLGRKQLTLCDSQASVGAFEKGRSSRGLQTLCRRTAAYRLAGCITWRLRYIESARNPPLRADQADARQREPR